MWREKLLKWGQVLAAYLFWPVVCLVVWGELNPHPIDMSFLIWNKAPHFLAYFGLAGMATVAFKGDRRTVTAVLGLIVLGGILEVLQGFTGRDPAIFDEGVNTVGALLGSSTAWLLLRFLRPKILAPAGRDPRL